jgi:large subunit ribosomal protein L2
MPLRFIPTGMDVHAVEMQPGGGAKLCRAAGMYARLTNKEGGYATLVMPSGEIRRVLDRVPRHHRRRSATPITSEPAAGQSRSVNRHLGVRPKTRGVAKSHNAHPLGGGSKDEVEGQPPPCGPTGVEAKGGRTRNRKKHPGDLIIRRRRKRALRPGDVSRSEADLWRGQVGTPECTSE